MLEAEQPRVEIRKDVEADPLAEMRAARAELKKCLMSDVAKKKLRHATTQIQTIRPEGK